MEKRKPKRIYLKRSPISKSRLEKWRQQIAEELPELVRRNQLADDAMKERTFSGRLRRAIHQSTSSPMKIAEKAQLTWSDLDDFLTGENTLPSDAIDRLIAVLKWTLPASRQKPARRPAKAS